MIIFANAVKLIKRRVGTMLLVSKATSFLMSIFLSALCPHVASSLETIPVRHSEYHGSSQNHFHHHHDHADNNANHHHQHHHHHHRMNTEVDDDIPFCGTHSPDFDEKTTLQRTFTEWKHTHGTRYLQEQTAGTVNYSIPMQFSVFEAEDGRGNLTDSQIDQLTESLNRGFRDTPFSFYQIGVPKRARNDTLFKCSPEHEMEFKTRFRVGEQETLNVFLCNLFAEGRFGIYGVADFPRADFDERDGVLLMNPILPKEGVTFQYMEGVISHEVGHWLGLYHTFEGACEPFAGDEIADTAAQLQQTQRYADPGDNCWQTLPDGPLDTCPNDVEGVDPGHDAVDNFMNYIAKRGEGDRGECLHNYGRFTPMQIERMVMMYETFRMPKPATSAPTEAPTSKLTADSTTVAPTAPNTLPPTLQPAISAGIASATPSSNNAEESNEGAATSETDSASNTPTTNSGATIPASKNLRHGISCTIAAPVILFLRFLL